MNLMYLKQERARVEGLRAAEKLKNLQRARFLVYYTEDFTPFEILMKTRTVATAFAQFVGGNVELITK